MWHIIYRWRGLEKFYSMMIFLGLLTETITIKTLKKSSKMVCQWKISFNSGVLYINRKIKKM